MIKGFYAAVSAMVTHAARQQLLAHDVANLDTPGFKQIMASVNDFTETPVYNPNLSNASSSQDLLGLLGLGAQKGREHIDFGQGGLKVTGNPYDFAIEGEGFFRVRTPNGERYTRDGRFLRGADGNLTTVEGFSVLGDNGQPIKVPEGQLSTGTDGTLSVDGKQVGRLALAVFKTPDEQLTHDQGNLFSGQGSTKEGAGRVVQSSLEMSNANPTQLMTMLMEVARSYEAAQKMVQNQDELLGKTIASLGRLG